MSSLLALDEPIRHQAGERVAPAFDVTAGLLGDIVLGQDIDPELDRGLGGGRAKEERTA
jgi:hypothetical protein